jgi:hypothetical protein
MLECLGIGECKKAYNTIALHKWNLLNCFL